MRIVYAGSLYRDRESLTEAVGLALRVAGDRITVTFAGPGGEWVEPAFPDARVRWLGTLSERECYELVAASDIGLLVYFADEPYYEIVHPTKLSLYLAGAVPILSGDARYIARFVTEHGIGLAVSREEFAGALLRLIEDEPERRRMTAAAASVREEYFWDAIYDRAVAATRTIAPAERD